MCERHWILADDIAVALFHRRETSIGLRRDRLRSANNRRALGSIACGDGEDCCNNCSDPSHSFPPMCLPSHESRTAPAVQYSLAGVTGIWIAEWPDPLLIHSFPTRRSAASS